MPSFWPGHALHLATVLVLQCECRPALRIHCSGQASSHGCWHCASQPEAHCAAGTSQNRWQDLQLDTVLQMLLAIHTVASIIVTSWPEFFSIANGSGSWSLAGACRM